MRKLLLVFITLFTFSLVACSNNVVDEDNPNNTTESVIETQTSEATQYETISLNQIEEYVENGYIIADVREIEEYNAGHIPGAINAPLSALELGEFSPLEKEEKYVVICRSGNRSVMASNILMKNGFDIVNVSEGVSTWPGELAY